MKHSAQRLYRVDTFDALRSLILILFFASIAVKANFHLEPPISETVLGESTYFDCTTTALSNEVNWYHYGVGAKDHEDTCLYCMKTIHQNYEKRLSVERIGNGTFRLKITSVQQEDAGSYICQDDGGIGNSLLAQLIILESSPVCHTYIKPDGLLGPNGCNMEPDVLRMSCGVAYHGNIPPKMQWRQIQSVDPIEKEVSCSQTSNVVTCSLAMIARLDLRDSSYICETTTTSGKTQYQCSTSIINVIHANVNNSVAEVVIGTQETVNCWANSSHTCSYTWTWFEEGHESVVSESSTLTPAKIGWYRCEALCKIREKQCKVVSRLIKVSQQTTNTQVGLYDAATIITIILSTTMATGIFVTIIVVIILATRNESKKGSDDRQRLVQNIQMTDNNQPEASQKNNSYHSTAEKQSTVLENDISVVKLSSATIEVHDTAYNSAESFIN